MLSKIKLEYLKYNLNFLSYRAIFHFFLKLCDFKFFNSKPIFTTQKVPNTLVFQFLEICNTCEKTTKMAPKGLNH